MSTIAAAIDAPTYHTQTAADDAIIAQALAILGRRIAAGPLFDSPQTVRDYLVLRAGSRPDRDREVFSVLFLDSQNRLVAAEDLFFGTLTQTSVYPREVVRYAMRHGSAAVILTHNHPSGEAHPSRADEALTQTLKAALALVDVRVLDHIITAGGTAVSMAEKGLI